MPLVCTPTGLPGDGRRMCWAILCRSINRLDGDRSHLAGTPDHPTRTMLFESRRQARQFIKERWGYIATRPDFQREPHGWRMPCAVRVAVGIEMLA
jgi:hypothetical protein